VTEAAGAAPPGGPQDRDAPDSSEGRADTSAPLDVLLTAAALGPLQRWLPGTAGLRFAARLATRPRATVRRASRHAIRAVRTRGEVTCSPRRLARN